MRPTTALGAAAAAGDFFKVNGAGDTTGNDLEAAKGSAVVANDVFFADTASSVKFIRNIA